MKITKILLQIIGYSKTDRCGKKVINKKASTSDALMTQ